MNRLLRPTQLSSDEKADLSSIEIGPFGALFLDSALWRAHRLRLANELAGHHLLLRPVFATKKTRLRCIAQMRISSKR